MKKILVVLGIVLFNAGNAFSQIEGMVADQKNTGIANVIIIAIDSTSKVIDTVRSDKRGGYAFKKLQPGKYSIEAKATGFQTAVYKNIQVGIPSEGMDAGDDTYYAIRLDIILMPAKVP